ncbi:AzlD domain-containing protein [Roseovarius aestuariivivens]|uniref:AzlD domain-containing protein n=1 Tax=Roseovarius aestuariivivens TaxID=1888910 RepID=UPI00107FDEA0|nr:AzlD domain-containing protein [Roseovarius aestuariivivens]
MIDTGWLWFVIVALGAGSFALRFVFIGLIGDRDLPPWILRHLRYTAVAVLPGLVAPMVAFPAATNGDPDPARLIAAAVTISVGLIWKNAIGAIVSGAGALYLMLYLLG